MIMAPHSPVATTELTVREGLSPASHPAHTDTPPRPFLISVLISTSFFFPTRNIVFFLLFDSNLLRREGWRGTGSLLQTSSFSCAVPSLPPTSHTQEDGNPLSTTSVPTLLPRANETAEVRHCPPPQCLPHPAAAVPPQVVHLNLRSEADRAECAHGFPPSLRLPATLLGNILTSYQQELSWLLWLQQNHPATH